MFLMFDVVNGDHPPFVKFRNVYKKNNYLSQIQIYRQYKTVGNISIKIK